MKLPPNPYPSPVNILISIGNSDDKLTQRQWSEMITDMRDILDWPGVQLHGEWFSRPDSPWQNANWCVEVTSVDVRRRLRRELRQMAEHYEQDSIAWTEGEVEFLGPQGST